ncbi:Ribosome biogenesis ATPase rix7 [Coemansia aciculifera]|uniref:Ribosome biogenesis ATPase rix7 n=1 Tax=Coemansia aciculifera TaxID=417176 RepID=A0A9W8M3W1_9FUNG|nr:Ribosome biogenesis ATPase rix7 [Coemansia aciculifera]
MVSGNKKQRVSSLSCELDQVINRLLHDYATKQRVDNGGEAVVFPTPAALVEYVRKEKINLQRKSVLQLEKSIERVLPVVSQQLERESLTSVSTPVPSSGTAYAHSSDEEPDFDGSMRFDGLESVPTMEVKDNNAMNGSLMRLWAARTDNAAGVNSASSPMASKKSGGGNATPARGSGTATPSTQDREGHELSTTTTSAGDKRRAVDASEIRPDDAGKDKDRDGKRKRRPKSSTDHARHAPPETRLSCLGGVDSCIEEVLELIVMPLKHPEIYLHTGVQPPRGVLLHGPPGCGKTLLANAIAGEVGVPFLQISAPSIVSGMSGESEKKLREVFEEARDLAPCIIFIDEIDAITPKRENAQREMERRIVAQMLTCIDDLSWEKTDNKPVMLIGATNRPDSLDPALRRAGRFDREIAMPVPDEAAREQILGVMCAKLLLSGDFDIKELAKRTPGYVGADLTALTTAAGMIAVKRIFHNLQTMTTDGDTLSAKLADKLAHAAVENGSSGQNADFMCIDDDPALDSNSVPLATSTPARWDARSATDKLRTIADFLKCHPDPLTPEELAPLAITNVDFLQALTKVQPSAKREGFATVPGVTWDDIGALSKVREELRMAVVEPIRNPEVFAQVGITAPAGVLLWGPPGNGKTLLAKAIANESHTNFISVKGGELMSKYVGDSERAVRQVFSRARASSPCVIFFDELDALCSRRSGEQSEASARVVNTLLTEIDGMESRKSVYVIAATNRPDIIDPAMLRPGRLDKLLFVELPTPGERADILRTLSKRTPLADDVCLDTIAAHERCNGFSGADLAGLIREASVAALRSVFFGKNSDKTEVADSTSVKPSIVVTMEHFSDALLRTTPSVSATDMRRYESLRKLYGN